MPIFVALLVLTILGVLARLFVSANLRVLFIFAKLLVLALWPVLVSVKGVSGADSADFNGVRRGRVENNDVLRVVVGREGRLRRKRRFDRVEERRAEGERAESGSGRANGVERGEFSTQRGERLRELRIPFRSIGERGGFGVVQTP